MGVARFELFKVAPQRRRPRAHKVALERVVTQARTDVSVQTLGSTTEESLLGDRRPSHLLALLGPFVPEVVVTRSQRSSFKRPAEPLGGPTCIYLF